MYNRIVDYRWSFRDAITKEYTHCYHIYPAMMIPQVARSLMEEYKPGGVSSYYWIHTWEVAHLWLRLLYWELIL